MCNLKEFGGLGIVDFRLKNRALLNKWIWRYGEEPNAMWRLIIASKYGGDHYGLIPFIGNQRRFSRIWENITKPLCSHDNLSNASFSGIGYSLGDGSRIRFWWDNWTEGVMLKSALLYQSTKKGK